MSASTWQQSRVMLKTNLRVKLSKTRICNTFFEIVYPMVYVLFAFGFASALGDFDYATIDFFNATTPAPPYCPPNTSVAFAPDRPAERGVLQNALTGVSSNCMLTGYADYGAMRAALLDDDAALRSVTPYAVILDLPASTYTMLIQSLDNSLDTGSPSGLTKYTLHTPGTGVGAAESPWNSNGGLLLELGLDRALAERHTPGAAATMQQLCGTTISTAQLPTAPFTSRYAPGTSYFLYVIPLYVTAGTSMLGMFTLRPMVVAREKKLVEGMIMMGLTTRAYNNGWYLTYLLTQCLAPVVSTFVTVAIGFISWQSNVGFLFITMLLHSIDSVIFLLMILPLVRSAASSELFAWFLMLFPGMSLFVVCGIVNFPTHLFWPFCLISTAAAPLSIALFIQAEMNGGGITSAVDMSDGKPLVGVWAVQVFDAFLYAWLAWYFNQIIPAPGSSATVKPWDFCLPRCLQCSSLARALLADEPAELRQLTSKQGSPSSSGAPAVRALHLKKTYPATPAPVHALVDLSFDMAHGEVTGLLGQNGAGKSTAIHIMCGLVGQTSGAAVIYDHDVSSQMDNIRSFSGICPQHDLLFDELSVTQHIELFAGIKGADPDQTKEEVTAWLERLGIGHKANSPASELSGGQRRKLSLIIALISSPKFVLLDEPTAGMDPESRRAVWEFVLANKGGRATLLTTHFMDEADVLCSKIVVVSKGLLAAVGSPSELKVTYASGYHLVAALSSAQPSSASSAQSLLAATQKIVANAQLEESSTEQASITLPAEASASFARLFTVLDEQGPSLGITSYGVSLPSLQEAFVKILDAQKGAGSYAELAGANATNATSSAGTAPLLDSSTTAARSERRAGRLAQMRVMIIKAWAEYTAELWTTLLRECMLAMIVVFAFIIGVLAASDGSASDVNAPIAITLSPAPFSDVRVGYPLPYLAETPLSPRFADNSPLQQQYAYTAAPVSAPVDYSHPTSPHRALSMSLAYDTGAFAAFALPNYTQGNTILYNASYPHALPAYASLLSAALIDAAAPGLSVTARVGRLPALNDGTSQAAEAAQTNLMITPILMVMALLQIVLVTATKLASERFNHTKQLLLLSGLDVRAFWSGFALVDAMRFLVLVVGVGTVAAGASGGLPAEAIGPMVIVELCALPGVLLFSYLVTLPFRTSENASAAISLAFMLFGLLPTAIMSFIPNPTAKLAIQIVLLLSPPTQILTGMSSILTVQMQSALAVANGGEPTDASEYFAITTESLTYDPQTYEPIRGTLAGTGLVIIFAAGTSLVYALAFYRLEIRKYTQPRKSAQPAPPTDRSLEDADVAAERTRVAGLPNSSPEAAVKVSGLSKRFVTSNNLIGQMLGSGPTLMAVNDLTFAMPAGSCFALLGPNGAGKTTAINVLTGDLSATTGEVSLQGLPANGSLTDVYQQTGFCPQLKGLWRTLTLRQHLTVILRLKGFEGAELQAAISQIEKGYGLEEHAHKMVKRLSGGTQRKLSCAMALSCGNPKVVFVDEPTTGVDVGTRRFIWDRIKEAARDRVVVLTTHYMDEADALAQRIGIMAAGKLRVLGSPQHLKSRHGGGYRVELKARPESKDALTQLVGSLFTNVKRVDSHQGTLVFEVAPGFALAQVFAAFEEAKATLGLDTFTMSQTTLEEVFLRVVEQYRHAVKKQMGIKQRALVGAQEGGSSATPASGVVAPQPTVMEGVAEGGPAVVPLAPANVLEDDYGPVKQGWYVNGCCNIYWKVTPTPRADPPAYKSQCMCFALEWFIPIPCCCCPAAEYTLDTNVADPTADEEGCMVYSGGNSVLGTRHVWREEGRFVAKSSTGKEAMHWIKV